MSYPVNCIKKLLKIPKSRLATEAKAEFAFLEISIKQNI
jgi:hypothetical protein